MILLARPTCEIACAALAIRLHYGLAVQHGRAGFAVNINERQRDAQMARGSKQSDRKFGIEIEALGVSMDRLAAELRRNGIECQHESYNHSTRRHWKVVDDASLRGQSLPFELVSPPLSGAAGLAEVAKVCEILRTLGAQVNKNCGFHVHVDAHDFAIADFKSLVHQFIRYEGCFDMLVAPSRRANRYAKSTRGRFRTVAEGAERIAACRTVDCLRGVNGMDRYHKLNLEAFAKYGTVEFRQHQGTVEFAKMQAWIGLCVGFVEKARSAARTNRTTIRRANGIRDFVKCAPVGVRPFLLARYAAFKAAAANGLENVTVDGAAIAVARARVMADLAAARASAARASAARAAERTGIAPALANQAAAAAYTPAEVCRAFGVAEDFAEQQRADRESLGADYLDSTI